MASKRSWKQNNEFSAEGMEKIQPRIHDSFRGMIDGSNNSSRRPSMERYV
jgi:hypothetical protein